MSAADKQRMELKLVPSKWRRWPLFWHKPKNPLNQRQKRNPCWVLQHVMCQVHLRNTASLNSPMGQHWSTDQEWLCLSMHASNRRTVRVWNWGLPEQRSFEVRRHPLQLLCHSWKLWCENHPNFESTWQHFHVYWGCCCMTKSRNVDLEGLISFTVLRIRLFMC